MASVMVMQGRELNPSDIEGICGLIQAHPEWNRTRLSRELCALWDWRNAAGRLLAHEHYLGARNSVGENIRYLVRDRFGRPVACALFGSAAWKCADRDAFIGWERSTRERNLQHLTNNTRFLIPRWVQVPHLASHVLGLIARRIRSDWQEKYGHPVHALETFVERSRFQGTCYRAANWQRLGETCGRTRNDRDNTIRVEIKDVYLHPLTPRWREELCSA